MRTYLKRQSWNAICDVCGFKFKAEDLLDRWDGLKVCRADWEMRHPQDLIQLPTDTANPPWTRPDDDMSGLLICTVFNSQGISGVGISGCAVAGRKI